MASLKELKTHLRLEALGRRDALDPDWRIEASLRMAGHAGAIDLTHGPVVSGFMPIRSEADLRPSMAALADRGARLCLPVVLDRETIVFRELVRGARMLLLLVLRHRSVLLQAVAWRWPDSAGVKRAGSCGADLRGERG